MWLEVIVIAAWSVGLLIFLSLSVVLLCGAPYVPTLPQARVQALDLLNLKSGQTLYELGCGDGCMLIAAAERGVKSVGYELNPFLYLIARWRCRRHRSLITVRWGNFWRADLAHADAVFVFLLDNFMAKLDAKIKRETAGRPFLLASNAFKVPGKKPAAKLGAIFLYRY